jgi:hypothetical protein
MQGACACASGVLLCSQQILAVLTVQLCSRSDYAYCVWCLHCSRLMCAGSALPWHAAATFVCNCLQVWSCTGSWCSRQGQGQQVTAAPSPSHQPNRKPHIQVLPTC